MQRFQDIKVWQRSHALALDIYRLTESFSAKEQFGLTSQLRRAASSVPTNIAEGSKRLHQRDYGRFLNMAEGSIAETEYLLILSKDLGMAKGERVETLIAETSEIAQMLFGLRARVDSQRV
jgi:S23 ribosomal protein.